MARWKPSVQSAVQNNLEAATCYLSARYIVAIIDRIKRGPWPGREGEGMYVCKGRGEGIGRGGVEKSGRMEVYLSCEVGFWWDGQECSSCNVKVHEDLAE